MDRTEERSLLTVVVFTRPWGDGIGFPRKVTSVARASTGVLDGP